MRILRRSRLPIAAACMFALVCGAAAATAGAGDPWSALRRPLDAKQLKPGSRCPVTATHRLDSGHVPNGLGSGPVYPNRQGFSLDDRHPAWIAAKTLWSWRPALRNVATRVLVRGRRLDGAGVMKFELGPNWGNTPLSSELHILTTDTVGAFGNSRWGATVTLLYVRTPGCYELQLDTAAGTQRIVLKATRG